MSRVAFFDLANGISGDMTLAALVHAGRKLDEDVEGAIADAVASLPLDCAISFVDDERGGIACLRTEVKTDGTRHPPQALRDAIASAAVDDAARTSALRALDLLVDAEARVHGVDPDDVHLHELASGDTAVDLLGAAVGLRALDVDAVAAAVVPVPRGWIDSEHGRLPLPAPVVLELLRGARVRGVDAEQELVTPSGAAILVAHDATFGLVPEMTLRATGIGCGARVTARPNVCRVLIGEYEGAPVDVRLETCVLLEANIDDQTPEALGYAVETLMRNGALDVWITPIVMKKSRPAFALSVLCTPADEERLARDVFRQTSTIGLRRRTLTRRALEREVISVSVRGRGVRVKIARLAGEVVNVAPESDDCAAVAEAADVAFAAVYDEAASLARAQLA